MKRVNVVLCFIALFAMSIEGFAPRYSPLHIHDHLKKTVPAKSPLYFHPTKQNPHDVESIDLIDFLESVKLMAEKTANCWSIPGLNIGIVIKNQTYTMTAGIDDSINSDTNFGIGSTSKAFTSLLIGELVDQGKLDWTTPVRRYTPAFSMFDPVASNRVTIRDMLTHKTGMPDHSYDLGVEVESEFTRSELFYSIKTLEPGFDFRSEWHYSNLMVMSAGYIAEEVTGRAWEDLSPEMIFDPVGMTRTCPDLDCALAAGNLAMPTLQVSSDPVTRIDCGLECNRWLDPHDPAGGIYSNVEDLVKWVQLHLNTSGVELVSADTLNELHTPQTSLFPSDARFSFIQDGELISVETHSYAYNWFVENYRGWRNIQHGGTTWGYNAQISLLPDIGFGFVGLSSGDNTNTALVLLSYYAYDMLIYKKSWVTEAILCADPNSVEQPAKPSPKHRNYGEKSSDVSQFAGTYQHPYFGSITFTYEVADSLYGTWQTAQGNTTYLGDNFFMWHVSVTYLPASDPYNALDFQVEFQRNINGDIDSLVIDLQPGVPAIVFTNDKWIPRGVGWPISQ